ncbi:4-hydroxy-tetrahydrodipicolinate synthase [Desertihabitans brevis]|nr:4-hydroxy-tetrahydrodipicolinate synthase [Desertihabitans brevis]
MMEPPFGRVLSAMVTPFAEDGSLDLDVAAALARHLVDEGGHDGLVVNGTGGEGPTTTDAEKRELVRAVVEAVGDRASVVAGVGTFDTRHTLELAGQAADAGAHGLLVVTPYYSKPPQRALLEHFTRVADSTPLPVMLYDIPHRAGTEISTATLLELGRHERIVAVKDAKVDLVATTRVVAETGLAYYCGDDAATLPMLAVGGVGVVGTSTHFCGPQTAELVRAHLAGDVGGALALHRRLLPVYTGVFATQGVSMVKGTLRRLGRPVGRVRPPMVEATEEELDTFWRQLDGAGLL